MISIIYNKETHNIYIAECTSNGMMIASSNEYVKDFVERNKEAIKILLETGKYCNLYI